MAAEEPHAAAEHLEGFVVLTQSTLGQFISKPRLLPERLRKPPFRFLFDAVAEVARQTGFGAAELFGGPPGEKLAAPGAREEKIAFIEGWTALAAGALGEQAADLARVSPQDIVCGVRPEWTNYLLQCTAAAAWPDSLGAPPSPSQLDPSLARAQASGRAAEAQLPAAAAEQPAAAAEPEGAAAAEAPAPPAAEAEAEAPAAEAPAAAAAAAAPEVRAAPEPALAAAEAAVPALSAEEAVAADEGLQAAFEECDHLQEAFASTFAQTAGAWRPGAAGAPGPPAADTGGAPCGVGGQADSDSDSGADGGAERPALASTQVLRNAAAVTSKIDCELQQAQDLLERFEAALDQDEEEMEQRRVRVQALREERDSSAKAQAEVEAQAAQEAEAERAARKSKRRAEKAARKAREAAEAQERSSPAREQAPAQSFPVSATTRALGARMVACTGGDEEYAWDGDAGDGAEAQAEGEGGAAAAEVAPEAPAAPLVPMEGDLGGTLDAMLAADEAAPAAAASPAAGGATGSEGPLFNRLKAEMKDTFISYLCATMPEALIRKYSHDELIGCLQFLLKELRRCLELHGLPDVQDEESTDLAEELRVNFPNDWLPHLQGASPWALRQKYNVYELIDTLQGLASACSERLQDELGPLSRWAPEGSPLRCAAPAAVAPAATSPPPADRAASPAPAPQAAKPWEARPATGLAARPKPWEGFGHDISAASQTSTRHRASPAAPAPVFDATLGPAAWEVQQDAPGARATAGPRAAATAGLRAAGGQGPSAGGRPRTQYHSHALASR